MHLFIFGQKWPRLKHAEYNIKLFLWFYGFQKWAFLRDISLAIQVMKSPIYMQRSTLVCCWTSCMDGLNQTRLLNQNWSEWALETRYCQNKIRVHLPCSGTRLSHISVYSGEASSSSMAGLNHWKKGLSLRPIIEMPPVAQLIPSPSWTIIIWSPSASKVPMAWNPASTYTWGGGQKKVCLTMFIQALITIITNHANGWLKINSIHDFFLFLREVT